MTGTGVENLTRSGWLDDFELLEEIGRGGMGVVYRARWARNGRLVALKTLPSFASMEGAALERFQREAEAAGRIDHPGVVPILSVGECGGVHYFAMELVEGPSLFSLIDGLRHGPADRLLGTLAEETALDEVYPQLRRQRQGSTVMPGYRYARSCASIAEQIAAALAAAHQGGVIHRDIKPSNILISPTGQPVLVDFGLASDERMLGLTRTGEALGTPAYMAPEQACGQSDLDGRVDIYGLGATLYELLSMRPPFDGAHAAEIMRKIVEEEPVALRRINPRVPAKLEAIVHTCLAKEPEKRYESAEALVEDLQAFQAGRPIRARRLHPGRRLKIWLRKHHTAALVGTAIFAACFSIFVLVDIVSGQRREDQGLAALAEAQGLEGDRAQEAYGRARALLGEERVRKARRDHLQATFEPLYQEERHEELRLQLETWPQEERDEVWRDFSARLVGRGVLRIIDWDPEHGDQAFLRGLGSDGRLEDWLELRGDKELPIGEYLLRMNLEASAPSLHRVQILRDEVSVLAASSFDPNMLDETFALIIGGPDDRAVMVQKQELSSGAYGDFLAGINDPLLQKELLPRGWDKPYPPGDRELPVSGLSFRQARIATELLGGHLMSDADFALASVGGLPGLVYPWGREFNSQVVVADPDRLSAPLPVDSAPVGASPAGILNLVGNVAEILAPDAQERGQLAGGHYLSPADELRADARLPMGEPREQHDLAGLRLARFVPLESDDRDRSLVESRIVEITSRQEMASFCDWQLDARGNLQLEATLLGQGSEAAARQAFASASTGFLSKGRVLRPAEDASVDKLTLTADMQAGSGLFNRNGSYYMRLPLGGGHSGASLTRLELPDRLRIDLVEPAPAFRYVENDRQILLWDLPAQTGAADLSASLRFRRDGPMGGKQPVLAELEPFVASFLGALNRGDSDLLSGLLDPSFEQRPHQLRWDQLTAAGSSRLVAKEALEKVEIVDATTVGDIVTLWLKSEWRVENREGRQLALQDWRLRAQLRMGPQGYRVLSLEPMALADQGTLQAGLYVGPEHLKVSLEAPADVFIQRRHEGLSEVQVTCWPRQLQDVSCSLFGDYTEPGSDQDLILHRLTQGALSAQPGRRLQGPKVSFLGSREEGSELRAETVQDWLFGRPGGDSWTRERWIFVQLGRRWFFVRQRAEGSNPDEAKERFRNASESFRQIQRALHIR